MITLNKQTEGLRGAFLLQRSAIALLCLAAFSILVGVIANSFRPTSAANMQEDQVNVGIRRDLAGSISITVKKDTTCANFNETESTLDISLQRSSVAADCLTAAVNTDDINGYTLNINGPASGNLVGEASGDLIEAKSSGTMAAPTVFSNVGTEAAWGFGIPNNQIRGLTLGFDSTYQTLGSSNTTNTAKYAEVPTTPTTFSKTGWANTLDASDAPIDDIYNIYFAATANAGIAGDKYVGTVVISGMVNANPSFLPPALTGQRIQTVTASNCPASRTRVIDARDGATYWVRKVGNLCWMETNLAYAGGGSNYYGDVTPVIPDGSSDATGQVANARIYIPAGSSRTTGTTNPSPNVNGTGQYGYFYNWCAAMSNQPGACQNANVAQPNQGTNDGTNVYNVCPANWRLPNGGAAGELAALNTAVNNGSTSTSAGLLANSLYMFAGGWRDGSFVSTGQYGYIWSSTANDAAKAYVSFFGKSSVNAADYFSKHHGYAVRCVSAATDPADIPNPTDPDVEGPNPPAPSTPAGNGGGAGGNGQVAGNDVNGGDGGVQGEFDKNGTVGGSGKLAATETSMIPLVVGSVVLAAGIGTVIFVAVKRKKKSKKSGGDTGQDW
jgi:uncharacterized protein (TIGR02145 family)